jgi:hypothetical protein
MPHLIVIALGVGFVATASAACMRQDGAPSASGTELTSYAIPVRRADAVARLATERCRREAMCMRIGEDGLHETEAACLESLEHDSADELDAVGCRVLSADSLDRCVLAVRRAPCDRPLEQIEQLTECSQERLCR